MYEVSGNSTQIVLTRGYKNDYVRSYNPLVLTRTNFFAVARVATDTRRQAGSATCSPTRRA